MELYLDDERADIKAGPEVTLDDLLDEIKQTLVGTGRIIVGIRCDGNDVTGEVFQENLAKPSNAFERIDMHSAESRTLVGEALDTVGILLDEGTQAAAEVVDLLSSGKLAEAMPKLGDCCQTWGQIHQAICNSALMLGLDLNTFQVDGQPLPEILAVPADKLRQLKEVVEARDFVLLSDILNYEFCEAVESWAKIKDALLDLTPVEGRKSKV